MAKYIYSYTGRHGNIQYIKDHVWTAFNSCCMLTITTVKAEAKQYPENDTIHGSGLFKLMNREEVKDKMYCVISWSTYLTRDGAGNIISTGVRNQATTFNCKQDAAQFLALAALSGFVNLTIDEIDV